MTKQEILDNSPKSCREVFGDDKTVSKYRRTRATLKEKRIVYDIPKCLQNNNAPKKTALTIADENTLYRLLKDDIKNTVAGNYQKTREKVNANAKDLLMKTKEGRLSCYLRQVIRIIDALAFFNRHTMANRRIAKLLEDIVFSVGDVEIALSELKASSSAGPDGWPAFLLKTYRHRLAPNMYKVNL